MHCGRFCRPPGFPLRTPESGLFPENVLFFCGKKRYNNLVLCNLSPQGDGNEQVCTLDVQIVLLQLIPVRGRKPLYFSSLNYIPDITTYPREGTETDNVLVQHSNGKVTIYPRKGTETRQSTARCTAWRKFQLIPVRGRKLVDVLTNESRNQLQLIPARGR